MNETRISSPKKKKFDAKFCKIRKKIPRIYFEIGDGDAVFFG